MNSNRVWFHVDMDAFYASVEQRENPDYRGKPLIIGGSPNSRGVVSTASYEARKFGVHSAMPTSQAYRLCPQGIFIAPRMELYAKESARVMKLFEDFSPVVIQVSIDEAYIDMTGTTGLFGPPCEAARKLKARVYNETGLTISVGVGSSKLIAKMASGYKKPDGLWEVPSGAEAEFVEALGLAELWGVGKKTRERLQNMNITTIERLRSFTRPALAALFGESGGSYLYDVCRGIDPGIYSGEAKSHSISNERTFARDINDRAAIEHVIFDLSQTVMFRLLEEGKSSRTVTIKLRYADFSSTTAQNSLPEPVQSSDKLYRTALELLARRWNGTAPLRLVGLGLSDIQDGTGNGQIDLFADENIDLKRQRVEHAVLGIRAKLGSSAISKGSLLRGRGGNEGPEG